MRTIEVFVSNSPPADATIMAARKDSTIKHPHGITIPPMMSVFTGIQTALGYSIEASQAIMRLIWVVGTTKLLLFALAANPCSAITALLREDPRQEVPRDECARSLGRSGKPRPYFDRWQDVSSGGQALSLASGVFGVLGVGLLDPGVVFVKQR